MFYVISIFLLVLSPIMYPYIDISLLILIYGVLSYMDYKWIFLSFLSLMFVDLVWGRIFLLSFVYYGAFLFVMYELFKSFPLVKDYGFVVFTMLYSFFTILYHLIFEYKYLDVSQAFFWSMSQVIASIVVFILLSFIEKYKQNKSYLSLKNIRN